MPSHITSRTKPPMVSKLHGAKLQRGERVRFETPGGGGYGDPAQRSPDRVARDRALGYVVEDDA